MLAPEIIEQMRARAERLRALLKVPNYSASYDRLGNPQFLLVGAERLRVEDELRHLDGWLASIPSTTETNEQTQ